MAIYYAKTLFTVTSAAYSEKFQNPVEALSKMVIYSKLSEAKSDAKFLRENTEYKDAVVVPLVEALKAYL